MAYWSGRGIVEAAVVTNGVPGAFRDFGNAPQFDFNLSQEFAEHYESRSGADALDGRWGGQKTTTINAIFEEWNSANLALFVQGASSAQATTAVADYAISGATIAVGDILALRHQNVGSLVITDSAGTPATLVLNTHYTADLSYGEIKLLNIGSFVAPLKAAYTPGAATNVNMFTQPEQEMMFRLKGLNKSDSNRKVLAEFYRCRVPTASLIKMIGTPTEGVTQFELSVSVLADSTKEGDATLGQYGRIVLLP